MERARQIAALGRERRISSLRAAIEEGEYQVSSFQLAESLMQHMLALG